MRPAFRLRLPDSERWPLVVAGLLSIALALAATTLVAKPSAEKAAHLSAEHARWLDGIKWIITKEEKAAFLALEKDYQRDAFIEQFWKIRDPYPRTARNEFREQYQARLEIMEHELGGQLDDRAQIFLLNGPATERIEVNCAPYLWPIEVWYYDGSDNVGYEFLLLFFRRWGAGSFILWEPFDGVDGLSQEPGMTVRRILDVCGRKGEPVVAAINFLEGQGGATGVGSLYIRLRKPPKVPQPEWVATFNAYTTDVPQDAKTFAAKLDLAYPGRRQSRTVVRGTVAVPVEGLHRAELAGHASFDLLLNGEVLRDGKLHDSFRYRFDLPAADVAGPELPLVFERYLRPGDYQMIVRLEDLNGGGLHRTEQLFTVPQVDSDEPVEPEDPETARILAEANEALRAGSTTLQIVPLGGEWQSGLVRIDAVTTGEAIQRVAFWLDDRPVLTKSSPPWNVELDLGAVPRTRVLRAVGLDAHGSEVAADETVLNTGRHRFSVHLSEPRSGKTYRNSVRAEAQVSVPEDEVLQQVDFFLGETKLATLYQPPWIQTLLLPPSDDETPPVTYVRALASTVDGDTAEDTVLLNSPNTSEAIDVDLVELYTSAVDGAGRPVEGLGESDFAVEEDGVPQELVRFEQVRNLPIRVAAMVDVSASMEGALADVQTAALRFLDTAITDKDRATVVAFNDHPELRAAFTSSRESLTGSLVGLKAERGTALWDALVFTLYYFNGIGGQKAILLLSDGKDESSRFRFAEALEYAQRSGVAVYVLGLAIPKSELEARHHLKKLADDTGGDSFFVDSSAELGPVYEAIQRDLRSRYLLAYQSTNTSKSDAFRAVEVDVKRPGVEARTLKGYYPG